MIKFQGTRSDYGRYRGEFFRENGHDFCRSYNSATLAKQLRIYQKYYPELIAEKLATAEFLGLEPNCLLYEDLAIFVDNQRRRVAQHTHGCTIFAVHENGKTFVGRNYDWNARVRDFFESYLLDIKGAYRYFAFSDNGVWGRYLGKKHRTFYPEDAVNEHGLYIGLTYAHIDQWNYGLTPSHFIRYVAEHCKTTKQALNAFAKIPCAVPKNFLIADAKGDIAVVEHAAKSFEVVWPESDGVLVQTNHCLAPKLKKLDRVFVENPQANTRLRYEEAAHLVRMQMPGFQFTDIWRILRQSNYVYNPDTIWLLALELSEQRFNIYYDTAMGQKHTKFSFPEDEDGKVSKN